MPIYEYECPDCGRQFEEVQPMSAEAAPACPGCGCAQTRKLLSVSSLKGGATPFDGLDRVKFSPGAASRAAKPRNCKGGCSF